MHPSNFIQRGGLDDIGQVVAPVSTKMVEMLFVGWWLLMHYQDQKQEEALEKARQETEEYARSLGKNSREVRQMVESVQIDPVIVTHKDLPFILDKDEVVSFPELGGSVMVRESMVRGVMYKSQVPVQKGGKPYPTLLPADDVSRQRAAQLKEQLALGVPYREMAAKNQVVPTVEETTNEAFMAEFKRRLDSDDGALLLQKLRDEGLAPMVEPQKTKTTKKGDSK